MKYKIKKRRKTIKTKYIFLLLLISLICISISYAMYTTELRINGTAKGEQEQFDVTYLNFYNSTSYPTQIGYMSTYTYTFLLNSNIESIIMGETTLTLGTDYTYSDGTLTIPNVTGNLVIQADNSGIQSEYWVTYSFGNENFNGNKCINTGIPLFSAENVHRDFEISVELSNFTYLSGQDTDRNVILCNQNEATTPYQGFAFHYRDKVLKTQVNCTKVPDVQRVWGKTEGEIVFTRTNDALYQDGSLLYDFENKITPYNLPLSIGANLDTSGNARRYSKVDLSNITIKMKYSYEEYVNLCQNLPTPKKNGNIFTGWYTSLEGGTQITTMSQLDENGRILYAHWENAPTYEITFKSNGGSGTMNKQTVNYNTSTKLNSNTFTKEGYRFVGWATNPNGTGTRYSDGANVTLKDNLTLYAQWLSIPKTIYTADSITFDGKYTSIVDTGVYLFREENIHKNFEIYFEIDNIEANTNQATLLNTKDESGAPYPGFVYRVDQSKLILKADSTATNTKRDDRAIDAVQKVRIIRINDITYYSINDEDYQVLMDFSNIVRTFDAPAAIGGIIRPNASRERGFKGTLSNIVVKFIDDSATLEEYQNALPSSGNEP